MKNIINENKNKINAIVKRFTGQNNEDLTQEIFVKAWKNSENYKEQNKFSQWICTIAANVCKDYLKSNTFKNCQKELSNDRLNELKTAETPEKVLSSKQRQKLILDAVSRLPRKQREVINLYEFEEKSYEEISKEIKTPVGTVKSRLSTARKTLSEQLWYLKGED